jgi:hypothetical protein
LSDATFAASCFKKQSAPDGLESGPASAWLFEKGLKTNAVIWEHSIALPTYDAVLTLLVMREAVKGVSRPRETVGRVFKNTRREQSQSSQAR